MGLEITETSRNGACKVRQCISENMIRQKRFHDENFSFETFELGDKVYVNFPVKKIGCSSKLTSYWRGPCQDKLSDALYKVNCGREGLMQVIHCDRLRKARQQVLVREDYIAQENAGISQSLPSMTDEKEFEVDFTLQKRVRRKQEWMKDYILFISRNNMVKNKNTPRKASYICGICQETFQSRNIFKYHVLTCTMKELGCDICKK